MKVTLIFKVMIAVLALPIAGASYASDPCESVQREMTFGETAVEMANDKAGFLKAAEEFEKAIEKAPFCADAYYNLGLVYDKTKDYAKAATALETYLQLSPGAKDAAVVQKQIYRLEYLMNNSGQEETQTVTLKPDDTTKTTQALTGQWVLDDGYMKFAYILTPDGSGGMLLEFDRCLSKCGDFRPNPVNRYRLQMAGNGSLSGTHEAQWAGQSCTGRTFQAPVEAFFAYDQRSLIIKVGEHTRYNTYYCKFESGNPYSITLTR